MKNFIIKVLFLTLVIFTPVSTMAGIPLPPIPLPPPIIFPAPPDVVVIPDTDVYTVPDVQEEIFFYGGWWWRPWNGRWYRSHYYDRDWGYYRGVPSFNRYFYNGWRDDYRRHMWRGQPWEYQRLHHRYFHDNWRHWESTRHWHQGGAGWHGGGHPDHPGGGHPGNLGGGSGHHGGRHPGNLGGGGSGKHGGGSSGKCGGKPCI